MKQRFSKWGFERKMKMFFSVSIFLVSFLVLLITTVLSTATTFRNARQSAESQLSFLCANYEASLEQYKSTCFAILMDRSIQEYLKRDGKSNDINEHNEYLGYEESSKGILQQIYNANDSINFIGLINDSADSYIYRGEAIGFTGFEENWSKDWEESIQSSHSTMRLSFSNNYYHDGRYTLSIYFPAYSNQLLGKTYGLLCINLEDTFLESINTQTKLKNAGNGELMLVNLKGTLVSGRDTSLIGKKVEYAEQLTGASGRIEYGKDLITYQKIGDWNYYLISASSAADVYKTGITMAVLVAGMVIVLIFICTTIAGKILSRVYAPLDEVVKEMGTVSSGRMDVRINAEPLGEDFEEMAEGFNTMMDKLCDAMEEVKEKQEQLSQTKLNALQSQIQPHFLYNTLECIHWQAVAEGNKEISSLVKALASYYRICLSKGKDIIPFSEELQHIKYYILIQNMRSDHKVELDIQVNECYNDILLPKLTLQPLVENAVEHGIRGRIGTSGKISIWVEHEQDILIKIADSGNQMTREKIDEMNRSLRMEEPDFGYGVRNVNRRIQLLFGERYGLEYAKTETRGTIVSIRLPYSEKNCQE